MALQEQLVQFPFAGGLDEGVDEHVLEPPAMLSVLNGVYTKDGSIGKRYGFAAFASITGTTRRMATRGDELLAFNRDNIFTYSSQSNAWTTRDRVPQPMCTRKDAVNVTADILEFDSTYANGFIVDGWVNAEDTNVYAQVTDAVTGAAIFGPVRVNNTSSGMKRVHVVTIGTTAIVAYSSVTDIWCKTIDLTAPTALSAETSLAGLLAITGAFAITTTSTNVYVSHELAGNNVRIRRFSSALAFLADVTLATAVTTLQGVASAVVDANLFVTITDTNLGAAAAKVVAVNLTTLATVLAATTVITTTDNVSPRLSIIRWALNTAVIATSSTSFSSAASGTQWRQVTSAGTLGTNRRIFNSSLGTQLFACNGRLLAGVTTNAEQPTCVIVDLNADDTTTSPLTGRPVGTLAPRQTSWRANSNDAVGVAQQVSTLFSTLQSVNRTATGRRGMTRMTCNFDGNRNWLTSELAQYLYVASGVPCQYDGVKLTECGFIATPSVVSTSSGAGTILAGTYQWKVCYVWVDTLGRTHRSQPSLAFSLTFAVSTNVTLDIRTLPLTVRQELDAQAGFPTPVYIEVYRTVAGGTNFRRVTTEPYPVANQNSLVAATVSITDSMSDAILTDPITASQHPFLYTTGGTYENVAPPSFTAICQHQNRIFGIGDDELTIWFSEEFAPPETPAFHDEFTFLMPERATALFSLDDKLVIWTERSVYIMTGLGPAPNGANGAYDPPQLITSDVGCIEPRSIVKCPQGVFFQSHLGLMLLTRGLEVQWKGSPVQDTLDDFPIVTSAILVAEQHHVRFMAIDGVGSGMVLVWDYVRDRWATWSLGSANFPADGGCFWRGRHVLGGINIIAEDTSTYLDGGTLFVPLQVETPNIKISGITGYQRVWKVLAQFVRNTPHGLQAELALDYFPFLGLDVHAWTDSQITAMGFKEPVRRSPKYGKCTAIRVRLTDVAPTVGAPGSGQGATFVALGLLIGVVPGARKKLSAGAKA